MLSLVVKSIGKRANVFKKIIQKIYSIMCIIGSVILSIGCAILLNKRRATDRNSTTNTNNEDVNDRAEEHNRRTESAVTRFEQAADRISEIIGEVKENQ